MAFERGRIRRFVNLILMHGLFYLTTFALANNEGSHDAGAAVLYSADDFARIVPTKPHLVLFFAPWCGHCQRLTSVYEKLGEKYNGELQQERVVIAKVDCTVETALCSENDVAGYPTLLFYWSDPNVFAKFKGKRDYSNLEQFVEKMLVDGPPKEEPEKAPPSEENEALFELTDADFDSHIAVGHHFVKFFAPWCGHCQLLAPTWEELAEAFADDKSVSVAKVDCTKFGNVCKQQSVRGYPTLIFFSRGKKISEYHGSRNIDALTEFLRKTHTEQSEVEKLATVEFVPEPNNEKSTDSHAGALEKEIAHELTDATFESHVSLGYHFIKFYAPWCGHCQKLAPIWDQLVETLKDDNSVTISKISEYRGSRSLNALEDFVKEMKAQQDGLERIDSGSVPAPNEKPEAAPKETALALTDEDFDFHIKVGHHFVKFFAPWCGHCRTLAPTWDELAKTFQDDDSVTVAKVDCTKFQTLCSKHSVRGYPTLIFFSRGMAVTHYHGSRSLDDLKEFALKTKAEQDSLQGQVLTLNENLFETQLEKGHTFVHFFQQGCDACESLSPVWTEMAQKFQPEPDVYIAEVDCSVEAELCRHNGIDSFPTLVLYYKGDRLAEYKGPLDLSSLYEFVLQGLSNPQSLLPTRDEL